jgi:hypothetical protein
VSPAFFLQHRADLRLAESLHIDVELQEEQLLVTARGTLEFDAALRLLKQACATAKDEGVNKILVNGLALKGELSTVDRYRLGAEMALYLRQLQMLPRLAFVGKPPTMDGFGVRVAQNRDVFTEIFSSQQAAQEWLYKWPQR